jgi:hypothetical protein
MDQCYFPPTQISMSTIHVRTICVYLPIFQDCIGGILGTYGILYYPTKEDATSTTIKRMPNLYSSRERYSIECYCAAIYLII